MYCQHSSFRLVQLYIHRRDRRFVPLLLMYIYYNKFKKHNDPCKSWVKYQKLCHNPKSIPPGKGGKPYGKSPKNSSF